VTQALSLAPGGPTGHRGGKGHTTVTAFASSICAEGGTHTPTLYYHPVLGGETNI